MGLVLLPETVPEEVTEVTKNVLRTVPGDEAYLALELCHSAIEAQST